MRRRLNGRLALLLVVVAWLLADALVSGCSWRGLWLLLRLFFNPWNW